MTVFYFYTRIDARDVCCSYAKLLKNEQHPTVNAKEKGFLVTKNNIIKH